MKKVLLTLFVCVTAHELWHRKLKEPTMLFWFQTFFEGSPDSMDQSAVEDVLGYTNYLYENYERLELQVRLLGALADHFGFEGSNFLKELGFPARPPRYD